MLFRAVKKEGANADKETSAKFQSFLRVKSQGVNNRAREVIEAAVLEMFKLDRAELGGGLYSWQQLLLGTGLDAQVGPALGKSMGGFELALDQPLLTGDVSAISGIPGRFKCWCRFSSAG